MPPPVDGAEDVEGAELCTGAELWTGALLCTDADDELEVGELAVAALVVGVVLGLGLGGGACRAGTAPALDSGVMLACCALPALDGASDPVDGAGADVFFTAEPTAKAATSPTTSATTNSNQRLRTSRSAGAEAIAATSPPDITELSIRSVPPGMSCAQS